MRLYRLKRGCTDEKKLLRIGPYQVFPDNMLRNVKVSGVSVQVSGFNDSPS
jgi:hypothetical protein